MSAVPRNEKNISLRALFSSPFVFLFFCCFATSPGIIHIISTFDGADETRKTQVRKIASNYDRCCPRCLARERLTIREFSFLGTLVLRGEAVLRGARSYREHAPSRVRWCNRATGCSPRTTFEPSFLFSFIIFRFSSLAGVTFKRPGGRVKCDGE